jgi:hypothetical protein
MVQIYRANFINSQCNLGGQMLIMADHETVQMLANTVIDKVTRITKYFRYVIVLLFYDHGRYMLQLNYIFSSC